MDSGTPRFSIVLGQRASWPEMLARVRETEALGFDGLFLVDHFFGLKDVNDPTHDAYTMLAALAPFTQSVRLGIMVCGNTYRNPALLLKQAMTVDHISGGRLDFGVGAGWLEREHEAYGFDFPPAKERVDRFAEALEIWELLQTQDRTTYEGEYYSILDAPFEPKSLQRGRLPLLIGGSGPRMLRLTARHADMWNTVGTPEEAAAVSRRLDEACLKEGRDPATLVRSVSPAINLLASPQAFLDGVTAYHEAGFRDIYMPWPRVEAEVPVLREVARDILPGLRNGNRGAHAETGTTRSRRSVSTVDGSALAEIRASLDPLPARLLEVLTARPGDVLEGQVLRDLLGVESHADVTRTFAALGAAFTDRGIERPWLEAQRGYSMPAEIAELMTGDNAPT